MVIGKLLQFELEMKKITSTDRIFNYESYEFDLGNYIY